MRLFKRRRVSGNKNGAGCRQTCYICIGYLKGCFSVINKKVNFFLLAWLRTVHLFLIHLPESGECELLSALCWSLSDLCELQLTISEGAIL